MSLMGPISATSCHFGRAEELQNRSKELAGKGSPWVPVLGDKKGGQKKGQMTLLAFLSDPSGWLPAPAAPQNSPVEL